MTSEIMMMAKALIATMMMIKKVTMTIMTMMVKKVWKSGTI